MLSKSNIVIVPANPSSNNNSNNIHNVFIIDEEDDSHSSLELVDVEQLLAGFSEEISVMAEDDYNIVGRRRSSDYDTAAAAVADTTTQYHPCTRVSSERCSSLVMDYEGQNKDFFINTNEESNVFTWLRQCPYSRGGGGHPLFLEASDDPRPFSQTFLFSSSEDKDFTPILQGHSTRNAPDSEHNALSANSGPLIQDSLELHSPGWVESESTTATTQQQQQQQHERRNDTSLLAAGEFVTTVVFPGNDPDATATIINSERTTGNEYNVLQEEGGSSSSTNHSSRESNAISMCIDCHALFTIHVVIHGEFEESQQSASSAVVSEMDLLVKNRHQWFVLLQEIGQDGSDSVDGVFMQMEHRLNNIRCEHSSSRNEGCYIDNGSSHSDCHDATRRSTFTCRSIANLLIPYSRLLGGRDSHAHYDGTYKYPAISREAVVLTSLMRQHSNNDTTVAVDDGDKRRKEVVVVDQWLVNVDVSMARRHGLEDGSTSASNGAFVVGSKRKLRDPIYSVKLNDRVFIDDNIVESQNETSRYCEGDWCKIALACLVGLFGGGIVLAIIWKFVKSDSIEASRKGPDAHDNDVRLYSPMKGVRLFHDTASQYGEYISAAHSDDDTNLGGAVSNAFTRSSPQEVLPSFDDKQSTVNSDDGWNSESEIPNHSQDFTPPFDSDNVLPNVDSSNPHDPVIQLHSEEHCHAPSEGTVGNCTSSRDAMSPSHDNDSIGIDQNLALNIAEPSSTNKTATTMHLAGNGHGPSESVARSHASSRDLPSPSYDDNSPHRNHLEPNGVAVQLETCSPKLASDATVPTLSYNNTLSTEDQPHQDHVDVTNDRSELGHEANAANEVAKNNMEDDTLSMEELMDRAQAADSNIDVTNVESLLVLELEGAGYNAQDTTPLLHSNAFEVANDDSELGRETSGVDIDVRGTDAPASNITPPSEENFHQEQSNIANDKSGLHREVNEAIFSTNYSPREDESNEEQCYDTVDKNEGTETLQQMHFSNNESKHGGTTKAKESTANGIQIQDEGVCNKNQLGNGGETDEVINPSVENEKTEACIKTQAGKRNDLQSPPKIDRIVLREKLPYFPRFNPVAIESSLVQPFDTSQEDSNQDQDLQASPKCLLSHSVSSSAATSRIHNGKRKGPTSWCNSKRIVPSVARGDNSEILSSQCSVPTNQTHIGRRRRRQSAKATFARVSTSPCQLFQQQQRRISQDGKENESSHYSELYNSADEVTFDQDDNCSSDRDIFSPPGHTPLSTISPRHSRTHITQHGNFPSPTSTVNATVHDFKVPRRKSQTFEVRDRPFPISSGRNKRIGITSDKISVSNQSNSGNVDSGTTPDGYEHQSRQLSSNQPAGDDCPRYKSRSKKRRRSIEKKLLATKKKVTFHKPPSALVPLSRQMEKPAWQFSCKQMY